jgi:hypothetical protein
MRDITNPPDGQISEFACPAPPTKIFLFSPDPNQFYKPAVLSRYEGRIAIVTDVGIGCGGRGSVGRANMVAGRVLPVSDQSAQTNGAIAYGEVVWSWHPLLMSSLRRQDRPNRVFDQPSIR